MKRLTDLQIIDDDHKWGRRLHNTISWQQVYSDTFFVYLVKTN